LYYLAATRVSLPPHFSTGGRPLANRGRSCAAARRASRVERRAPVAALDFAALARNRTVAEFASALGVAN
jgi:hypothetical protein